MNCCGCTDTSEYKMRGGQKGLKGRYGARKPEKGGKKRRKRADLSVDGGLEVMGPGMEG